MDLSDNTMDLTFDDLRHLDTVQVGLRAALQALHHAHLAAEVLAKGSDRLSASDRQEMHDLGVVAGDARRRIIKAMCLGKTASLLMLTQAARHVAASEVVVTSRK